MSVYKLWESSLVRPWHSTEFLLHNMSVQAVGIASNVFHELSLLHVFERAQMLCLPGMRCVLCNLLQLLFHSAVLFARHFRLVWVGSLFVNQILHGHNCSSLRRYKWLLLNVLTSVLVFLLGAWLLNIHWFHLVCVRIGEAHLWATRDSIPWRLLNEHGLGLFATHTS